MKLNNILLALILASQLVLIGLFYWGFFVWTCPVEDEGMETITHGVRVEVQL